MLVRRLDPGYQIVLQPDHGSVSGQLAAAWVPDPAMSEESWRALLIAASRHDDGWSVWERHPRLDGEGRPQIFFAVALPSLLSSYRACVDIVAAEDPGAGLFISMHVSGLQRNRYGVMEPGDEVKPLSALASEVRGFVEAEEARQDALMREIGCSETERWRGYRLLQVFDVFSLYLGLADVASESRTIPADPRDQTAAALRLVPGKAAWTVRCDPYPFLSEPTSVRMRRRVLERDRWSGVESFRADFAAAAEEEVEIALTR